MKGRPNTIAGIVAALTTEENGCRFWPGAKQKRGYGTVGYQGKRWLVHKLLYEHFIGLVPEGMELDHLCRNPPCAELTHLEPVTHRENMLRGVSFGAVNARKTACPFGHPYAGDNLHRGSDGYRECRTCHRDKERERRRTLAAQGVRRVLTPDQRDRVRALAREWTYKKAIAAGRTPALAEQLRTHCPQGHPYSGDNLYLPKRGGRQCRACRREHERERKRKQQEQH